MTDWIKLSMTSNYEDVTVTKTSSGWEVSSKAGTDTLAGIERLEFADKNIALDIDGNAGAVAKLLGAFLGAEGVQDHGVCHNWI